MVTKIENAAAHIIGTSSTFDYTLLPQGVADFVVATANKIRRHQREFSAQIIEIGADLLVVKDKLKHGQFTNWLLDEFGWTDRTARNYMRAAERFASKSETVSVLRPTTVYKLASPSTPQAVVDEVLDQLERDDPPNEAVIEAKVETARAAVLQKKKDKRKHLSRANARTRERHRQEWEAEEKCRRTKAAVTAAELISDYGLSTIGRVLQAAEDFYVTEALRQAIMQAEKNGGAA